MKLNKLSLNTIGLNRIGLNRIGSPSVGSSVTDRPYISPDVLSALAGVWIADGKSNTDPDRNIIKNKLPGRGGDFEIFNAAYKLNSGFGKYDEDFSTMKDYGTKGIVRTSSKIYLDESFDYDKGFWLGYTNSPSPAYKVRVSGIPKDGVLNYTGGSWINLINGINELPARTNTEEIHGFVAQTPNVDWSKLVIEQIPEYEGSFVTDGVNDMIVSQNPVSEMLGGSNELTVVSMMYNLTDGVYTYNNQIRPYTEGYIRNKFTNTSSNKLSISGYTIIDINYDTYISRDNINIITDILGDKNDFTKDASNGKLDGKFSVEGRIFNDDTIGECSQVAWYWTFIAKRALTTDEINQVIAYYNLDKYVKPDIYYNVKKQGLTNDTPDEDWYLKDFSGNGRDMTLYNYARTPESGINEEGGLQSDGVDDYGQFVGDLGLKDYTVAVDRAYQNENVDCVPFISSVGRTGGAPFLMEMVHPTSHVTYPYSFGTPTESVVLNSSRQISYQSTYVYNRNSIARGNSVKTGDGLTIGSNEGVSQYSKLCLWSFLLFPYTLSEFLLERQLKKHKLGTLYPGMVEFRPIVKSNIPYSSISYSVNPGEYVIEGSTVTITITLSNPSDKLVDISSNAISDISISGDNGVYEVTGKVTKSPQKINIVISSYLTMLDNETLITNETLIKNE